MKNFLSTLLITLALSSQIRGEDIKPTPYQREWERVKQIEYVEDSRDYCPNKENIVKETAYDFDYWQTQKKLLKEARVTAKICHFYFTHLLEKKQLILR